MTIKCDITGDKYIFLEDFIGSVMLPSGHIEPWQNIFLDIIKVNYHSAYIVFKDGTIKCALEANMYVSQYDGALEAEINEMYNELTFE